MNPNSADYLNVENLFGTVEETKIQMFMVIVKCKHVDSVPSVVLNQNIGRGEGKRNVTLLY